MWRALQTAGVITGYRAVLDPAKIDRAFQVLVHVTMAVGDRKATMEAFEAGVAVQQPRLAALEPFVVGGGSRQAGSGQPSGRRCRAAPGCAGSARVASCASRCSVAGKLLDAGREPAPTGRIPDEQHGRCAGGGRWRRQHVVDCEVPIRGEGNTLSGCIAFDERSGVFTNERRENSKGGCGNTVGNHQRSSDGVAPRRTQGPSRGP